MHLLLFISDDDAFPRYHLPDRRGYLWRLTTSVTLLPLSLVTTSALRSWCDSVHNRHISTDNRHALGISPRRQVGRDVPVPDVTAQPCRNPTRSASSPTPRIQPSYFFPILCCKRLYFQSFFLHYLVLPDRASSQPFKPPPTRSHRTSASVLPTPHHGYTSALRILFRKPCRKSREAPFSPSSPSRTPLGEI